MQVLNHVPEHAAYLGSEHADGSIEEEIFDAVDAAIEPVAYRDAEGVRHYFDLFQD
jgi:hypothetical protein